MTTDHAASPQVEPVAPAAALTPMIVANLPADDRYALTLNMKKKYQRTLKVAAGVAKELELIEGDTLHELMNFFVNLGLEYIKNESLKRQGYK